MVSQGEYDSSEAADSMASLMSILLEHDLSRVILDNRTLERELRGVEKTMFAKEMVRMAETVAPRVECHVRIAVLVPPSREPTDRPYQDFVNQAGTILETHTFVDAQALTAWLELAEVPKALQS